MHFKENPERIHPLAVVIAEIISYVADQVRLMDHPWFYDHFAQAIEDVLHDKATHLYGCDQGLAQLRSLILPQHSAEVR